MEDYTAGVPEGVLGRVLDDKHLYKIAEKLLDWQERVAPELGLTEAEIKDIEKEFKPARQR